MITRDRSTWIDTMIREEHNLRVQGSHPVRAGISTALSFLVVGLVPLLPFLLGRLDDLTAFIVSAACTAAAFFVLGSVKGRILNISMLRSGLETLLMGGGAAALAFFLAGWLRQTYGVA